MESEKCADKHPKVMFLF